MLREERPETKIVMCEPDNVPIIGSGIPQPRTASGAFAESHPNFRPHPMQGWTPDFIPKLVEDALAMKLVDRIVPVNGADAMRLSRELAQQEGIFVGITAGATLAGALEVAASAPADATIVCMLPDTGERYLSTPLFSDIPADMTEEELQISRSTPSYRFDRARLFSELALARADGSYPRLLARLARADVLVLDDWAMAPITDAERRDLLEVLEDRYGTRSTIVTSQLAHTRWHGHIGDPTHADATCDRLIHNAHKIVLKGPSRRKTDDAEPEA